MENLFKQFNKAFTLAEVLITLVIIGVVAALTIPTAVNKYREQEISAKVKKCYSTLNNAFLRSKADNGDLIFDNVVDSSVTPWFNTYMKPYLVTTKVCYNTAGCWNSGDTKLLNGNDSYFNRTGIGVGTNIITAILSDGTFINIDAYTIASELYTYFKVRSDSPGIVILFDINGDKGPNMFGKDIFAAIFTNSGFVPSFIDATGAQIDSDCSGSGTGYSCIMKYLQNQK